MRPFRECFSGLVRMARPHRFRILVSMLIGLVGVAASLAFVWISKKVVDVATSAAQGRLEPFVLLMIGIMLLQVACRVGARYWEGLIVVKAQNAMRAAMFRKVMYSTWTGKDRRHSGDTVSRLEEDIRVVVDFICVTMPDLLITVVQLVAASVYLFVLSPGLAWILLIIMPVAVLFSRLFFRRLRALTGEIRAADARVQGHIQENTQRRVLVRMLGATARVLERLGGMQKEVLDKTVVRLNYNAVSRGFMQLGFAAGYALVFLWGVFGLTRPRDDRYRVLPGAAFATLGIVAMSAIFSRLIAPSARYSLVYGSLASLILLMFWLYLICQTIFVGAALNVALRDRQAL